MTKETSTWNVLDKLPKKKARRTTMLDILNVSTKEIYITKAYAYFLDHRSGFKYQEVFARYFFNEILGKEAERWIKCEVRAEQTVHVNDKELRIDLLFLIDNEALIVENKIYAGKYNDMDGYENGVKERFQRNAVRKTFLSFESNEKNQVFHEAICGNMKTHLDTVSLNERDHQYYQILEFVEHMINLNKNQGKMEDLTSYLEHINAIVDAESIKWNAWNYFDSQIGEIGEKCIQNTIEKNTETIDESYFDKSKYRWIHIKPSKGNTTVYLTIAFEEFLKLGKEKPIYLIVESTDINFTELENHFNNSNLLPGLKKASRTEKYWRHYFIKEVYWPDQHDSREMLERLTGAAKEIFSVIHVFSKK